MHPRLSLRPTAELLRGRWPFWLAIFFTMLPLGAGPEGAQEGSGLRQVVLASLYLAATFAVIRFPRRLPLIPSGLPITFVLMTLYACLSAAWSPDVWVSFKRVVQIIGILMLGMALLVGGNGKWRLHKLLPPLLLVTMLLAILVSALFPHFAFADNGFRAFMATKNNFGQFAALCLVVPLVHVAMGARRKWLWVLLALFGAVGLVLSRSATTAVAVVGVGALYAIAYLRRRIDPSWRAPILTGALVVVAALFAVGVGLGFPDPAEALQVALAPTGRDVTLSGRTQLWALMWREATQHPWFGLGYGGFWRGLEGASGQVAYLVKWGYPGQAHNGYLDLFNELGIVGCAVTLAFLVEHARNLGRLVQVERRLGLFHAALFVLVVLLNGAEATLLRPSHPWWVLFVASVIEVTYLAGIRAPATAPGAMVARNGVTA